jgi:hypothetical protein
VTGFVGLNQNYVDIWGTTIDTVRSVSLMGQRGQIMVNRAYKENHIDGVMVTILAVSAVYHGLEPLSGQTKD